MNDMIEVKTADLIGPALDFMKHMADVNPSDGRVTGIVAGWGYLHRDKVSFLRDGVKHSFVSIGVPVPLSHFRGYIAAKLGDTVQVPKELMP